MACISSLERCKEEIAQGCDVKQSVLDVISVLSAQAESPLLDSEVSGLLMNLINRLNSVNSHHDLEVIDAVIDELRAEASL